MVINSAETPRQREKKAHVPPWEAGSLRMDWELAFGELVDWPLAGNPQSRQSTQSPAAVHLIVRWFQAMWKKEEESKCTLHLQKSKAMQCKQAIEHPYLHLHLGKYAHAKAST